MCLSCQMCSRIKPSKNKVTESFRGSVLGAKLERFSSGHGEPRLLPPFLPSSPSRCRHALARPTL